MIPLEVITMLSSSLLSGVLSIVSQSGRNKAEQNKALMQRHAATVADVQDARKHNTPYQSTTRRYIAWASVLFIICLPKIVPLIDPTIPVYLMYLEEETTGWWIFGSTFDITKFQAIPGVIITSADLHFVAAVSGFYFGSAATKKT